MADKLRATQQLEALQARHVGTGHADTTKFEWQSNVARDQYSNFVGHPATLQYMSIGVGMPRALMRNQQIDKMIQPMQPPKCIVY
ncbi:splicing factor 3B subunit 5/RDS3 complex subunit 10 [Amniculicola lignicola CBS 123094]|uniref:Splicing factor 3B subunit 5/RDS3 complex subunit 10 n=1 Tax=Amniculicola lignicola CBS 123094 TaxID=1392246 RepID=A0A6A5W3U5_9PLEO|nr:splicing factor 3B subunit 5/RDS3 complex subunit 10 [Amniculicola lignicola CBS 123094]